MRIIHAADIHLDSPMRGLVRYEGAPAAELRDVTRRALKNLVDLVLEVEAPLLVVAGDLYDGDWPDYGTGLYFQSQMVRLEKAGVRVAMVRGNHDAQNRMTRSLRLPDNVIDLPSAQPKTEVLGDLGIAIHGQSYARQREERNLAAGYPPPVPGLFNLGILHTSLDGRPGHEPYAPCNPDDLVQRGYDYWALGHVHAHEIVRRDPWIVFPGNLQGRHARELGPKGACVIELQGGGVKAVWLEPCDVMRWEQIDLDASGAPGRGAICDEVGRRAGKLAEASGGRPLALRVSLTGTSAAYDELVADPSALRAELQAEIGSATGGAGWLEKVEMGVARPSEGSRAQSGPLAELAAIVDELAAEPRAFADSVPELEALSRAANLPADSRAAARLPEIAARLRVELEELLKG